MSDLGARKVDEVRARGRAAVLAEFGRQVASIRHQKWGNPWGYVFVAPAVILFLTFQGYPLLRGFLMAFSDYRWLIPETQGLFALNGLANFREMMHDPEFFRSFGITLRYTVLYLPTLIVVSLFIAVMISKVRNPRMAAFYRVVAYMPVVLPVSVVMMMWRQIYHPQYGYLNHVLTALFKVENPPYWLGDPKWAMWAVLFPDIWKSFGYYTLLFLMGIYNIDPVLYEAAAIDGAGGWHQFRYITLPLLKPIITLVLVLTGGLASSTVSIMTMFDTSGGPAESVLTVGLYAYRTAFVIGDMRMGYAAAISLVLGLISALFSGVVFRLLRTERA